ncbi:MAG: pilus assembly protein PilP [Pelovirga sp.]
MNFHRFHVSGLFFALLVLLLFTAATVAVAQQETTGADSTEAATTVEAPAVEGAPVQNGAAFVYHPRGRRDPFTPLVRKDEPLAEVVKTTRRPEQLRGPLERFELTQLRLIAVLVIKGDPRAMVSAPDGKSYTVKLDDYIGLDGGRVKAIQTRVMGEDDSGVRVVKNPDRIVVEEVGIDTLTGKTVKEERYITL